jgi:hypothetical protein
MPDLIDSPQAGVPTYFQRRQDAEFLAERGRFGAQYFADTVAHDFPMGACEIFATAAAVVDTLVGSIKGGKLQSGGEALDIPVGTSIKGTFRRLKLASGKVIVYLAGPIDEVLGQDEVI